MFEKILVGIDGSEGSKKALAAAIAIAKRFGAELQSISVKERPSHYAATVGEVMEDQEEVNKFFAHVTEEALDLAKKEGVLMHRMRAIAFSILTPFYFLKAGSLVAVKSLVSPLAIIIVVGLLAVKMVTKFIAVMPSTLAFRFGRRKSLYTTLLMSTGLTFGTISALYGFSHGYIDRQQYTWLVTVVILSAIVPTLIAERFFRPGDESPTEPVAVALVAAGNRAESEA